MLSLVQAVSWLLLDSMMHLVLLKTETLLFSAQAQRPTSSFLPSDSSTPNPGEPRETIEKAVYCPPSPFPFLPLHHTCITGQTCLWVVALEGKCLCNKRWLGSFSWNGGWWRGFFCCVDGPLWCLFLTGFLWYTSQRAFVCRKSDIFANSYAIGMFTQRMYHTLARYLAACCFGFLFWPL